MVITQSLLEVLACHAWPCEKLFYLETTEYQSKQNGRTRGVSVEQGREGSFNLRSLHPPAREAGTLTASYIHVLVLQTRPLSRRQLSLRCVRQ